MTRPSILSSLFPFFFALAVFTKNILILVPFHFILIIFCTLLILKNHSSLNARNILAPILASALLLTIVALRRFNEVSDDIYIEFYFLIVLPFFIYTSAVQARYSASFLRNLVFTINVLNIIGISIYAYVLLTADHSSMEILFKGEASESRRVLTNTLESFVFADTWGYRYSGYYMDPNRWSFCLIVMYALLDGIKCIKSSASFGKTYLMLSKSVILISIILTLSRAGIIGLMIYFILSRMLSKKYSILIVSVFIVSALAIVISAAVDISPIIERANYGLSSADTKSRTSFWLQYISHIFSGADSLLLGVYSGPDLTQRMPMNSHNIFFFISYQFGIIAFIFFLLFIYLIYLNVKSIPLSAKPYIYSAFISLFTMTLTEDYLLLPIFWFFLSLPKLIMNYSLHEHPLTTTQRVPRRFN